MPGIQDLVRVSLVSRRHDIINITEAMCSDEIRLAIASDFSSLAFSDCSVLLIDASLFITFDLKIMEQGEKFAAFSICILPADIPRQVLNYVEKTFRYIIPFPINIEYFRSYCLQIRNILPGLRKEDISSEKILQLIPDSFSGYFGGDSGTIKKVRSQIQNAACSKDPVLILGETGTGKTTAAQVIHALSERKCKKMVSVSLSTIVETLAESAFFGHIRGSFTNADFECSGYFEVADGTTLFLDELGVASLSMQAMLLTVLETGNFKKIGDNKEQHVDVRMIFATNADLEKMLKTGNFRRDLYYRICDNLIKIPPLRSHKEDIRGMILHYLDNKTMITEEALEFLENYNWPGNIRELHKCLNRASINCVNKVITIDSIDLCDISFPQ